MKFVVVLIRLIKTVWQEIVNVGIWILWSEDSPNNSTKPDVGGIIIRMDLSRKFNSTVESENYDIFRYLAI